MGFKEHLKDEMSYQGLTTKELAEKSGVNKRTIDHYLMTASQEPSVTNAHKIAKALNVSIEYLLTGEEHTGTVPITGQLLDFVMDFETLESNQKEIILKIMDALKSRD